MIDNMNLVNRLTRYNKKCLAERLDPDFAEFYLKECFSNARVIEFCALRQNVLCILIDADRKEALSL